MDGWLTQELEDYLGPANLEEGILSTAVPGLSIFQTRASTHACHTVYKPVVCAVVQGAKRVELGNSMEECDEGKILSVGFDALVKSSILRGSADGPYRAVSVELDFSLLEDVAKSVPELSLPEKSKVSGLFVDDRGTELSDAIRRLFLLVHTPRMIPVLAPGIHREIAYHLLAGPRGRDILRFSFSRSHTRLLSGAVREIQRDLSRPLRIPELAASIGMSLSTFHQRFKELTSYSPIQYQKRLRLLEARRILAEGAQASDAAYRVGYQSPSQFSREYTRLFGISPRGNKVGASVAG
jgi:AraC-like DNA-binding protein